MQSLFYSKYMFTRCSSFFEELSPGHAFLFQVDDEGWGWRRFWPKMQISSVDGPDARFRELLLVPVYMRPRADADRTPAWWATFSMVMDEDETKTQPEFAGFTSYPLTRADLHRLLMYWGVSKRVGGGRWMSCPAGTQAPRDSWANPMNDWIDKRTRRMGFVYMLQSNIGGNVKIGFSTDPVSRIRAIQAVNPFQLVVPFSMPGTELMEAAFHTRFAALRQHGEFFEPGPELAKYIDQQSPTPWFTPAPLKKGRR